MAGRKATTNIIPGDSALSVNNPGTTPPEDWLWVSLNEVARMATGHTPSRNHPEYWGGNVSWIAVGDCRFKSGTTILETKECTNQIGIENSAAVLLPKGTVCLSRTGSIGYVVIMGKEMATSQGFVNWVCSEILLPRFLQLLFMAERSFLYKISEGTAHTTIYFPEVKAFNICLPPLPTQRAIVAKIEALFSDLDKGIADLKKAQDQLKVYRQAVLKKAFEGELTKEWREQSRFTKNDWRFPPLGEVLIQSKEKHKPENVENLFYVGLEHIGKETGSLTETVSVSEIKTIKNKFKTGQILYGKLRPYLNKVYLAKESGVCSTDILVFNLEDSIVGKFAVQFMLSRQFVNDMSANTNGVNLPRVSTKYVNNYKFPLPSCEEQHQIVQEIESRLSVCDKVEESINESLEKAKALRQSILKKAFEGTLLSEEEIAACKAAPDYEPASVLLEKIKAEKKK